MTAMSDLYDKVASLESEVSKAQQELDLAQEELDLAQQQVEQRRKNALPDLLKSVLESAMGTLKNRQDLVSVTEGRFDPMEMDVLDLPCEYRMSAFLSSAYSRKGWVATCDEVDTVNKSYQDGQCVVLTVVLPRQRVQDELDKFTRNAEDLG